MVAYYNEFDPYAAQWLRNLIAAGHIAYGDVDDRSILEVKPDDIKHYTQCHFFAGIGGWSLALRIAGWSDDHRVWTGSCPCQPFSAAGKGGGMSDERHLWPAWHYLIGQCEPPIVFGEQVDAAIRHGWLDLVSTDLEGIGYAFGASGLPAASVGAPHIRQRLWFVGESVADATRSWGCGWQPMGDGGFEKFGRSGSIQSVRLGEPNRTGSLTWDESAEAARQRDTTITAGRPDSIVANGHDAGLQGRSSAECHSVGTFGYFASRRTTHPWDELEWLPCSDGKTRPTQPGLFPLANGVSSRVGRLRAYGNAIVPQVAAEWIKVVMSYRP